MFVNVKIGLNLELEESVSVDVKDCVEISIDCYECKALNRTIIIGRKFNSLEYECFRYGSRVNLGILEEYKDREIAFCTPSCHLFPAYFKDVIILKNNKAIEINYLIEYSYTEFIDIKKYNRKSNSFPTWARISFDLTCPRCNVVNRESTQTNLVRPRTVSCGCGFIFYTEHNEVPVIEVL